MDIKRSKAVASKEDEGTLVHIKDERGVKEYFTSNDGKVKPVSVRIAGSYSTRARRAQDAGRETLFGSRGGVDADMLAQLGTDVLVACVIEWDGFTAGDQHLPCTADNVRLVLKELPWVREQLETAHNNHAAFFSAS